MPKVIIFNYPFVWICRLQLIVYCFLIVKVNGKKYMKRIKNSREIYGINVIRFDGLITHYKNGLGFFNTGNIRILSRMNLT